MNDLVGRLNVTVVKMVYGWLVCSIRESPFLHFQGPCTFPGPASFSFFWLQRSLGGCRAEAFFGQSGILVFCKS